MAASQRELSLARRHLKQLHDDLTAIIARDQEQEVRGIALAPVNEAIRVARDLLEQNPVASATVELFSADVIGEGEPIRAVDALLAVGQLLAALGPEPSRVSSAAGVSLPRVGGRRRPWNAEF